MRIIAGQSKGMRLEAPAGRAVRPSSDLLRGAVMSALGGFFEGERVLDIFAGTGAVALEFLSRGCGRAVAIEQDPSALAVLRHNASHTRLGDRLEVRAGNALRELPLLAGQRFEIVYLDPPYDEELYAPVLGLLVTHDLLAPAAELLVESRRGLDAALIGTDWTLVSRRKYGSSVLDRLARTPVAESAA